MQERLLIPRNADCGLFGTAGAREAVSALARWVGTISDTACRDIAVFPERCRSFSRDECVAVSLISACQHGASPKIDACARLLLDTDGPGETIEHGRAFADALASLDHILSPTALVLLRECSRDAALQNFH